MFKFENFRVSCRCWPLGGDQDHRQRTFELQRSRESLQGSPDIEITGPPKHHQTLPGDYICVVSHIESCYDWGSVLAIHPHNCISNGGLNSAMSSNTSSSTSTSCHLNKLNPEIVITYNRILENGVHSLIVIASNSVLLFSFIYLFIWRTLLILLQWYW